MACPIMIPSARTAPAPTATIPVFSFFKFPSLSSPSQKGTDTLADDERKVRKSYHLRIVPLRHGPRRPPTKSLPNALIGDLFFTSRAVSRSLRGVASVHDDLGAGYEARLVA